LPRSQIAAKRKALTAAALARATGHDVRSKTLKELEPAAKLELNPGKRIDLFSAALVEMLKSKQSGTKR
jgi:hypothetical protein